MRSKTLEKLSMVISIPEDYCGGCKGLQEKMSLRREVRLDTEYRLDTGGTYLPAGISIAEVREVVENPAVDATECNTLIRRVVHRHADQRRVRVSRLARSVVPLQRRQRR